MTPLAHFNAVWMRCGQLSAMQAYLSANAVGALQPQELLRAEWVNRVSALDLYLHRLVPERMRRIFEGSLPKTSAYDRFLLPAETVERIRSAPTPTEASAAFDLEVRRQLGFMTFQDPERIADAVRLCSSVELWTAVAVHQGATQATKASTAKGLKQSLSAIVDRRNKIAHEGDLQPTLPIQEWPIARTDLQTVEVFISNLVTSIDACV